MKSAVRTPSIEAGARPSEAAPSFHAIERRADPRRPTGVASVIFFESRSRSVDCTMLNMSARGVRVLLSEEVELPKAVQIQVGRGWYREALVRWRIDLEIGLEFVG